MFNTNILSCVYLVIFMVSVASSVCSGVAPLVHKSSFYLDLIHLHVVNSHSSILNLTLSRFFQLNIGFTKYKNRVMNLCIQNRDIAQLNFNLEFIRMCVEPGCSNICLKKVRHGETPLSL